ncbi:hypothetical protein BO70DRAFT_387603 [Aspergillus heteromorphus CBS 117.55]|uniref:Glycosyltransferase 2-like domain-containing protein n=1 Tax=Aspergillus heteromorphus CBS 117.55 TaxID=1448321 RepID=A0A317W1Y2_9EURO|nr:uncharacterized protein BO70DRAFT_387603 [Aspergillus heteromorphus CBS 117.55]PWY80584.1 hypothetical protein BO70DRAFT_387603 [Aspergillus heteromorphus CBS 117.55]
MDSSVFHARGPEVSRLRQFLNFLGCILILPVYYILTAYTRHPLTLDVLVTIFAAEYNRYTNECRRRKLYGQDKALQDAEKAIPRLSPAGPGPDCMAAVVGYREDPALFARALESYNSAEGCRFVLVGIDGDEEADMEMVRVFQKVYSNNTSSVIRLDEPFGELAVRTFDKISTADLHSQPTDKYMQESIAHCCNLAREILTDHKITFDRGAGGITRLCLYQPHLHKKGIMFTSFIFSIVISDLLGIEYLWSSDSDTIVFPRSLRSTVETVAGDPSVGGGSAGLIVHNEHDSAISKLGSVVYWCELYLTRSTATAAGTSDCQSGPSSAFRVAALPAVLYPWYTQCVLGHRMIINEDRHLTTNLLLQNWTITYVSDTLASTDTPTTLSKWLLQQVRWSRAGHIESFQNPHIYTLTSPLFFWAAIKRELGPLLGLAYILYYYVTGTSMAYFSWTDLAFRVVYTIVYNVGRNPDRAGGGKRGIAWWGWVLPAMVFYNVPLPAVHAWSLGTVFEGGWGTAMRGVSEKEGRMWKRIRELGFFVLWMGVVGGVMGRIAAGFLGASPETTVRALGWGTTVFSGAAFYGLVVRE